MAKTALLLALVAVLVGGLFVAGCVTGTPGNITVVTSTPAGTTPATTAPITTGTPAEVVTAVAPLTTAPTENITAPNTTVTAERDGERDRERDGDADRGPDLLHGAGLGLHRRLVRGPGRRAGHLRPLGQATTPPIVTVTTVPGQTTEPTSVTTDRPRPDDRADLGDDHVPDRQPHGRSGRPTPTANPTTIRTAAPTRPPDDDQDRGPDDGQDRDARPRRSRPRRRRPRPSRLRPRPRPRRRPRPPFCQTTTPPIPPIA